MDIQLKCDDKFGIIEIKSFKSRIRTEAAKQQTAAYAVQLQMKSICLALFVPVADENVLNQLSGETVIDGVNVFVFAIGWV